MKRFSFRLQKLLELRMYREREAELILAEKTGRVVAIEDELKRIAVDTFKTRSEKHSGSMRILELRACEMYLRRLEAMKEKALRALVFAEEERRKAQAHYAELAKDRKVLDKLKERREAEYYKELLAAEADTIDDIANGKPARERVGSTEMIFQMET